MISVESTKMCSCIKVTPRSALSMGPRTVFTMAKLSSVPEVTSGQPPTLLFLRNQSRFIDHLPQLVLAAESDFVRDDLAVASDQNERRVRGDFIGFENSGFGAQHRRIFEWSLLEKLLDGFSTLSRIHAENHEVAVFELERYLLESRHAFAARSAPGAQKSSSTGFPDRKSVV